MKAALKSQFTLTLASPEQLTDAVKKDFGDGVRYLWAKLGEPHQQDGQDFSYLVAPFQIIDGLKMEQKGAGVLCQTETETKETYENLSNRSKKHLVSAQWAGGGIVGWVTGFRRFVTEIVIFFKNLPDGKQLWVVVERETDKDTLEIKTLQRKETNSEGEAKYWSNKWVEESNKKKAAYFDSVNKSVTPPPPPRCIPLTKSDIQDLGTAKMTALQKQWPHCFEIFERQKSNPGVTITDQQMEDAYLLDLVRNGGESSLKSADGGKVRADMQLISSLHKAAHNYTKRGKSKIIDTAIYLLAFKWELGWCYLSDEELAQKLGEILETKFTSGQVKHFRYRTLGLVAKHSSGPPPNSP
jgi:hypothetical protein